MTMAAKLDPRQQVLGIIRGEHRSLAAVLHGLRFLARRFGERADKTCSEQEFTALRAMLHYIDLFPEQQHHPKENHYLFRNVRKRTREADALLDDLELEHRRGAEMIRHLEQGLLRFENGGKAYYSAFASSVEAYCDFHWQHMRKEEDLVFPIAENSLHEADWIELSLAFADNTDPLGGFSAADAAHEDFDKLFTRIVQIAPPPIGVGPV